MKPKIKEMYSLFLDHPLDEFCPENPINFGISIRLMIGPDDGPGSESFDVFVCTPDWIKDQNAECQYIWGFHTLIVFEYDFHVVCAAIESFVERCIGDSWLTIAKQLGRMGTWEFEDYNQREGG